MHSDYLIEMNELAFDQVTFTYPNGKTPIFNEASVSIKKGDKLALIGPSGIGKSSIRKKIINNF